MTSSPGLASTCLPSTVMDTEVSTSVNGGHLLGCGVVGADEGRALDLDGDLRRSADVGLELVLEAHDRRGDRRGGALAERADGGLLRRPVHADRDVVADVEQQVEVLGPAVAVEDALEDLLQP